MDVKKAIESRRSIRKYQDKPIPNNLVNEVINAARLAPSGNNLQPSRYIIVKDDETKKKLQDNDIIRDKWVYNAPVIIVCCTDPKAYTKSVEGWDDPNEIRAIRDLAIASSYLVLQATEVGLGTCYCGWIKKDKIKEILDIPQHFIVPYVITLGYPAETPNARPRKGTEEILL
jgi:nitroreductase